MNKVRIREIIALLRQAEHDGTTQSEYNWRASRLIWEEVQAGTKQVDLAQQIGKSQSHVTRLKKCWQIFVIDPGVEFSCYADLGSFYEAYNSPEVHGESQRRNERNRGDYGQGPGGKNSRSSEDEDFSADGLIKRSYTALSILANNPAFWPLLTKEGHNMLQGCYDWLDKIDCPSDQGS
jgi:hypothetical protein